MKIKKIKYSTPILLAVLVTSIFMLFFSSSISYKQFQAVITAEKMVIRSHKIIQTVQEIVSKVKDAETAQRGYLLTRDTSFLDSYKVINNKANQNINYFKILAANDIVQNKNIDTLQKLVYQHFNTSLYSSQKEEFMVPLSNFYQKMFLSRKKLLDKINNKADQIISLEKIKLKIREEKHQDEVKISPLTFLFTAFISLMIIAFSFFKISKDINTLKNANNQLLIDESLSEHSENLSNICNWYWNLKLNELKFSNNIHNLLRCTKEDFEQTVDGFVKFIHPDDKYIITDGSKDALENFTTSTVYYRVIRKDGELRYFRSISKLMKDNFDEDIMIGVISDITEQYKINKELADKVFDLERSNQDLLAFNHVASHDLQEPLRKIQTFISRIDGKEMDSLSDNGKNYFTRIKVAANRMQILIDDLISFSRTNKVEQAFESTDLNILLENSKQELAQLIEEKQPIIIASLLPTLTVIPFQIQQLFTNLIGNALKYSKSNEVPHINIKADIICGKDAIKSSFENDNKLYKISISDNGIGFDEQYAEEIFTLFNRLHNDNQYSGTGIGLAICKKIAENHKGFITAVSTPNIGSIFTIYIPI